jgi:NAD-dependent dihydropyrimidine dehydrogenase PreA subunit
MFWGYWAKVGKCTRCMRQSCAVCVGSWIVLIVALRFGASEFVYAASVLTAVSTALLITHVATYAQRRVAIESGGGKKLGRRLALKTFVEAAASSVLLMATNRPTFFGSQCGGWHGECDPCQRNFFLNEDPQGCHTCKSCARGGRNCGYENC